MLTLLNHPRFFSFQRPKMTSTANVDHFKETTEDGATIGQYLHSIDKVKDWSDSAKKEHALQHLLGPALE